MKTKNIVIGIAATFFTCSLSAQNQNDTVPIPPPRTDTIPPTDTVIMDTSNVASAYQFQNFQSSLKSAEALSNQITYSPFAMKENE